MHSRRQLLLTAGAALALAGCATATPAPLPPAPPPPAPPPGPSANEKLAKLLDAFFEEALDDSPELVTQLGLDKGARADAKRRLSDASVADLEGDRARTAEQLARMKAIDRAQLTGMSAINYDAVIFGIANTDEANRRFKYGSEGAGFPYVLSQLSGSYRSAPDFLGNQHVIETKDDADAYLSRLEAYAVQMDQETERARRDVGLGMIPPDFAIDGALAQMNNLRTTPDRSPLVSQLVAKVKDKQIAGDYGAFASKIYLEKVRPALERQIAFITEIRPRAVHDAGIGGRPDGEAYYALALRNSTTTTLSAAEIHQIGLEQARELSERADTILKAQGYSKGSVGARIQALYKDKKYHYANTDPAKEKLIADLNLQVQAMAKRLPEYFGALPKAPLDIKRVPKFIEAGAPGGYYNQATLDGSRPGIYWINLRDTAEYPTWSLPTLTYHEGLPGHHLQLTLQQEADLPMLRRASFLSAYGEGWALYAEKLAQEMGVYAEDPIAEIGYLQSSLFRSGRLVVDTGMHAMGWSREKAIATMTSIDGSPTSAAATEIERYSVWPGQACSYMVGKLTWLRLRDKARAALGPRFDIRKFHDAGLLSGAMPLTVLEAVIDTYIATNKA
ncbi:DUF885 family protein [Phenylobacterium sp.]|uniref:DUF885 domain-containing protein n=1 Tax=Phenylobacterium sp. TaxID=1871053 RepID=UPI002737C72A|nr:DUF885 family protein [Phenylobacterium sp.]MDP3869892.1 DUF885 family protein [Phenylobacterium sp.]